MLPRDSSAGRILQRAGHVELIKARQGFRGFSLAHNVRSEQEVDELVAQLEYKGARVLKRPEKVFWGGYSSYIADPDDNLWEIAYNPFLPLE